jgi:uncharacterized membrane protein HdeD (DUF308 family)
MKKFLTWILVACRVLVGIVVFKTGFDYSLGRSIFAYQSLENKNVGIFAMFIGIYFIFSSIFRGLFGYDPTDRL